MGNSSNKTLLKSDKIIKINGFSLLVINDYQKGRRNVICYSKKLDLYIKSNNLSKNNISHRILVEHLLKSYDDVKIIRYFIE
jgi:hypothetical protein